MARSIPPASRRLVGLLYIIAGSLLVLAQVIRLGVVSYVWQTIPARPANARLIFDVLLLIVGVFVIRFGWRVRRDGRISDEPGDGSIS